MQGPDNVLPVASSCTDVLLANIGTQLVQNVGHGLDLSVDRLLGFTPALVCPAEGSYDPELTYSSRDGEEVFYTFDLLRRQISPSVAERRRSRCEAYQSLGFQLHCHAVLGGLANGRPVGDALGGDANERTVGLQYLRDGPLFSV